MWGAPVVGLLLLAGCGRIGFQPGGDGTVDANTGDGGGPDGPPMTFARVASIAMGNEHACAARDDQTAFCWGANGYGGLGDGAGVEYRPYPAPVVGLPRPVVRMFAGADRSCALLDDSTLWCWGGDFLTSFVGVDPMGWGRTPEEITTLGTAVTSVAMGGAHMCAVTSDKRVWCWGMGVNAALGHGSSNDELVPRVVDGVTGVVAVTGGGAFTCALTDLGEVWCWGDNTDGQLGSAPGADVLVPAMVSIGQPVAEIAAGNSHVCARTSAGGVLCWGSNTRGELGDGTTTAHAMAMPVADVSDAIVLSAAHDHSCAIRADRSVWCWGANDAGQLGDGTTVDRVVPTRVASVPASSALASSFSALMTCATSTDGEMWCWGANRHGAGGIGRAAFEPFAGPVSVVTDIAEVAIGSHTCFRTTAGQVACLGLNSRGELGRGDLSSSWDGTPISGFSGVTALGAERTHSAAARGSAALATWGGDDEGQLGLGTPGVDRWAPMDTTLSNVAEIGMAFRHTCARTATGTAWCWGYNASGQLGDNSNMGSTTPVEVTDLGATVAQIDAGGDSSCAVSISGVLWCWGSNANEVLADGTNMSRRRPVQVIGLPTTVAQVGVGDRHVCARLTSGKVWCWGNDELGQGGDGAGGNGYSPNEVALPADAVDLGVGYERSCAVLADGRVFCWGLNGGALGNGMLASSHAPVEVVGLTSALDVSVGFARACARRSDGTVWCWGDNDVGELGRGYRGNMLVAERAWLAAP